MRHDDREALEQLVFALCREEKYPEAQAGAERIISRAPGDVAARLILAEVILAEAGLAGAMDYLMQLREAFGEHAEYITYCSNLMAGADTLVRDWADGGNWEASYALCQEMIGFGLREYHSCYFRILAAEVLLRCPTTGQAAVDHACTVISELRESPVATELASSLENLAEIIERKKWWLVYDHVCDTLNALSEAFGSELDRLKADGSPGQRKRSSAALRGVLAQLADVDPEVVSLSECAAREEEVREASGLREFFDKIESATRGLMSDL